MDRMSAPPPLPSSAQPAPVEVTLRDIAPAAFVPPALFAVGQGAIAPVVVISATQLGASPAMAALVVATAGLGQIAADIPAGAIVHRFGERPTMIGAAGLTILALLALSIFVTGSGTAVWLLARQAYVTEVVPYRLRATAMSTLGGVFRIGLFIGPFIGAAAVHFTDLWGAYAVHIVAAVFAAAVLLSVKDLSTGNDEPGGGRTVRAPVTRVVREQRSVFATVGTGVLVVIASMTVLGISLLLVPFTQSVLSLLLVGLVMGIGNGMSAGLVMTLGADLAPPGQRPVFLGVWRVFSDAGNGVGPFVIAGTTALATLGFGIAAMGVVGLIGAGWLGFWIPRKVPTQPRPTPRRLTGDAAGTAAADPVDAAAAADEKS